METSPNGVGSPVSAILVIDDDRQFVNYMSQLPEYVGYSVHKASNEEELLATVNEFIAAV
ncbi:MAG TPA: hypothetical protein ENI80_04315 [Acidiferrobacteraceae bacterium]|nr:hypothetical protein [Acidiferrobacteraceae bacterium]